MTSYQESFKNKMDWSNVFARTGNFPLDRSSIFSSVADAEAYAKGDGKDSRGLGKTAYVGQIISVYEDGTVGVYKIKEDRTIEELASASGAEGKVTEETKARVAADTQIANAVGLNEDGSLPTLNGTTISGATSIVDALQKLDGKVVTLPTVGILGGDGQYIQSIKQDDGSITATPISFVGVESITSGTKVAPTAEAVAAYVANNKVNVAEKSDGHVVVALDGNNVTISENDIASASAVTALDEKLKEALGDGGSVATQISTAIGNIKNTDKEPTDPSGQVKPDGKYVSSVTQANGIVTPVKHDLIGTEDNILSIDQTTGSIKSNIGIEKITEELPNNTVVKYRLLGNGTKELGVIEIPADRFLKGAKLSEDGKKLILTYNIADGNTLSVECDISTLLSQAEFKDGLNVDEKGEVSVKLSADSADNENNSFITIGDDKGIKLHGIGAAINNAKTTVTKLDDQLQDDKSTTNHLDITSSEVDGHTQYVVALKDVASASTVTALLKTVKTKANASDVTTLLNTVKEIKSVTDNIGTNYATKLEHNDLATRVADTEQDIKTISGDVTTLKGDANAQGSVRNIVETEYLCWYEEASPEAQAQ